MASSRKSRKRPSAKPAPLAVGLSGGIDSVVLLHLLKCEAKPHVRLSAVHVHHGLSANADAWAAFCRRLCKAWKVPLVVKKVRVARAGEGLEAAARRARYAVFAAQKADIALAHTLDDQAETVLMNLLRGAGVRGASGMPAAASFHGRKLFRPILSNTRSWVERYARQNGLEWIEDESNADESLTRNFLRRRVGPLLAERYPRWKESLARAAGHFARRGAGEEALLRQALAGQGLRAPSAAKLAEMLKQLRGAGARTLIEHEGVRVRKYRGKILIEENQKHSFTLEFRPAKGRGLSAEALLSRGWSLRTRGGGERLQPDARRPRRTLKNLFQEAGVPPWQREALPLLYCGEALAWVPGIGIDARFQAPRGAPGLVPVLRWRQQ
jgi:tRNA(Ile)-lysidine synthase